MTDVIKELMALPSSVMIGSRGLGLPNWNDTDIAVLVDELPNTYDKYDKFDLTNYFNVVPLGNNLLMKLPSFTNPSSLFGSDCTNVDVLIFDNQAAIDAIAAAMNDMYSVPKYMLIDKPVRVMLYELALRNAINNQA